MYCANMILYYLFVYSVIRIVTSGDGNLKAWAWACDSTGHCVLDASTRLNCTCYAISNTFQASTTAGTSLLTFHPLIHFSLFHAIHLSHSSLKSSIKLIGKLTSR